MTSINEKLNDYIGINYNKPRFQQLEIERRFNRSTHKEFLKKIRDHEDFYVSRSNVQHRLTVTKGEIRLTEVIVMKDKRPTNGGFLWLMVRYETIATKYFPEDSDFIIKLNQNDEVEVKANSAAEDFVSLMKFVDLELFESE